MTSEAKHIQPGFTAITPYLYAKPDLIDDPRTIAVGDDPRVFHRRRTTPPVGVRRVDTRRLQLYPHLAVPGLGCRELAADQNFLRRSLAVIPHRSHCLLPEGW